MTNAQARKWSEVFELMSDYRILLILVHLMESNEYVSVKELAKIAKVGESKARYFCEKLNREYILDQEDMNDETYYKMTNGRQANFVESILEKLT